MYVLQFYLNYINITIEKVFFKQNKHSSGLEKKFLNVDN